MKGVFVILDGVADLPSDALQGKTPLEVANTPNLDFLVDLGKMDYCYPIKEGVAPESSSAVVSLLGYEHRFAPRGPLEAVGAGLNFAKGDLALRCNFATVDSIEEGNILDSRAGRTLTTREAEILARAINEKVKLPFKFEFHAINQHRAVLIFRGGFSDNITNANPFYSQGGVVLNSNGKMVWAKSMDDEEDSKLSADMVNMFIRKSHEVLDKHPINLERARKGLYSANIVLCRDAGNEPVKFKKLRGKWMALGYMPLEIGIAKAVGMDVYKFRYPRLKGIDVYMNLHNGLRKAVKNAIRMLRRYRKKYDYFYVHLKETDIPGHDNKPLEKVKMIEFIDKQFFGFLRWFAKDSRIVVTADHTTACKRKAHTDDPVPVLTYPYDGKKKGLRFTEKDALEGRRILGRKLLQEQFFVK